MKVAYDVTPIALSRAGERRYALALLRALRARDDVAVTTLTLSRRVPSSFPQRLLWQALAEVYYPLLEGAGCARRARSCCTSHGTSCHPSSACACRGWSPCTTCSRCACPSTSRG